jgi:hypothetical protein
MMVIMPFRRAKRQRDCRVACSPSFESKKAGNAGVADISGLEPKS